MQIKFGTDGWRAIIADDFTVANLRRVAYANALWIKQNNFANQVVIGYDCRFGGKMFSEESSKIFASEGIKVYLSEGMCSTPMISLAAKELNCACGVILTASHNPPTYNGYKIKGAYGGPAIQSTIDEVEELIPEMYNGTFESLETYVNNGLIQYINIEDMYVSHAQSCFDFDAIEKSGLKIGYDAMFGAGQNAVRRLLPKATLLHCDMNPSFMGTAPEPIMKNLTEFSELIKKDGTFSIGFATDGDADRIGILDSEGNFIDSHHIILMLINYLYNYKGFKGSVVNSFSCTGKIGVMCNHFGLENTITKIGFKYICEYMIKGGVLVGGEESGGIAVEGHIPERDGIWIALTLIEYMAKTGKTLAQLVDEVYAITGSFAMERYDLHVTEAKKQEIISKCSLNSYKAFGSYQVTNTQNIDGFKFLFEDGSWVMIRPSGTEPILRVYSEASTYANAVNILDQTKSTILG